MLTCGRFDVVLVWASDRIARSVKHFLDVLDELNRIGGEYVSFRENIDTGGPLGRAIIVIIGAIAELERSLQLVDLNGDGKLGLLLPVISFPHCGPPGYLVGKAPARFKRLRL